MHTETHPLADNKLWSFESIWTTYINIKNMNIRTYHKNQDIIAHAAVWKSAVPLQSYTAARPWAWAWLQDLKTYKDLLLQKGFQISGSQNSCFDEIVLISFRISFKTISSIISFRTVLFLSSESAGVAIFGWRHVKNAKVIVFGTQGSHGRWASTWGTHETDTGLVGWTACWENRILFEQQRWLYPQWHWKSHLEQLENPGCEPCPGWTHCNYGGLALALWLLRTTVIHVTEMWKLNWMPTVQNMAKTWIDLWD